LANGSSHRTGIGGYRRRTGMAQLHVVITTAAMDEATRSDRRSRQAACSQPGSAAASACALAGIDTRTLQ